MASAGRILIIPKGNYDSSATYEMLDLVNYNGTSWLAKKTVIGIEPSDANSEYWHKMFNITAESIGALSKNGGVIVGNITIDKYVPAVILDSYDNRRAIFQKNAGDKSDIGTDIIDEGDDSRTILKVQNGKLTLIKQVDGVEVGKKIIAEIT